MLTWLIGGKSTGALSAGHISSNQQDDASRLRLLLIQSCRNYCFGLSLHEHQISQTGRV